MNTFNESGQIEGAYCYIDEVLSATYGCDVGWYTFESVANWAPESADDVVIPYGIGVQVSSDCGATITFSGEVSSDRSFIINDSNAGGYTWTGNCSPVDLTLKDFAITPPEGGFWSEASVFVNTFNSSGQIEGAYCYIDEVLSATYGCEIGWYTFDSIANWAPESAGDVPVASGEMFQISSDCGATITVPSALPTAE